MKRLFIFFFFGVIVSVSSPAQEPVYNIENVTGDLYRFQSNAHYGVFLVTEEGIILADPINRETATWLKGELDRRFGVPVKYVIYSHDHADHTSGGEVFEDTATFVSQVFAKPKIEQSGHTPVPDVRFPKNYQIQLGGKTVNLLFFGPSHSDNLTTVVFPEERAVFLVDVVAVNRLPYRDLPDYHMPNAIYYLAAVEQLDFDILIPGHGPIGDKADLSAHKTYLIELYNQVANAFLAGLDLEETKAKVNLEHYFHWARYEDWVDLNIEGMYRLISELAEKQEIPALSEHVQPRYPKNAAQMRFVGWVVLEFDVNKKGKPVNIRVLDSDAKSLNEGITDNRRALRQFEEASVKALKKSAFSPGTGYEGLYHWESFALLSEPGEFDPYRFSQALEDPSAGDFEKLTRDELMGRSGAAICCY